MTSKSTNNFVDLFRQSQWDAISDIPEVELAELLPDMTLKEQDWLLQNQSLKRVAAILSEADEAVVKPLLESWTASNVADVVKTLDPDDGVDLLGNLPQQESKEVLNLIEEKQAHEVQKLMDYDPETAGGLMTPDCIRLPESFTIEEAIQVVRDGLDAETINYIYILDAQENLKGVASMRDLLNADPQNILANVMQQNFVTVNVNDDKEEVAEIAKKYDFLALPVVDDEGHFEGIITVDDILDVVEEEASEDMFLLAGTSPGSPTLEPVWNRMLKRIPYLCITLAGGGVAALVLRQYRQQLDELMALSYFVPVVIGMAGNVGIQSSTVVVRGLATGDIKPQRFVRVFYHEIGIGVLLACFFCLLSALIVHLAHVPLGVAPTFGLVVGLGMASGILMAALIGTSIPLICERFGIDPALAAGPFVTTTNDVVGVFVYFQVAQLLDTWFLGA